LGAAGADGLADIEEVMPAGGFAPSRLDPDDADDADDADGVPGEEDAPEPAFLGVPPRSDEPVRGAPPSREDPETGAAFVSAAFSPSARTTGLRLPMIVLCARAWCLCVAQERTLLA